MKFPFSDIEWNLTQKAILENMRDAFIIVDQSGLVVYLNALIEPMFGYSVPELQGKRIETLIPEAAQKKHHDLIKQYFSTFPKHVMGEHLGQAFLAQHKDGHTFSVEVSISPLNLPSGNYVISVIRDVSDHIAQISHLKEKDEALAKANNELNAETEILNITNAKMFAVIELSETLLACENQQEIITALTSYADKILDFSTGMLYLFDASQKYLEFATSWGKKSTFAEIFSHEDCWGIRTGVLHKMDGQNPGLYCGHINSPNSDLTYICIPIIAQNKIQGVMCLEIVDKTEKKYLSVIQIIAKILALSLANVDLRTLLREQSIHDALTGLYNRRFLDEYLLRQIYQARGKQSSIALIIFDIDSFKEINDQFGHAAGDLLLSKIATLVEEDLRKEDLLCRYGGDEFVCALIEHDETQAFQFAERIRKKIATIQDPHLHMKISVSLGISIFPQDGDNVEALIGAADQALYIAKEEGKNQSVIYAQSSVKK